MECGLVTVGYSAVMMRACVKLLSAVLCGGLLAGGLLATGGCDAPTPPQAAAPVATSTGAPDSTTPLPAPLITTPVTLGPVHALVVTDLDGNRVPLSQFAGRPMIIEIWATWCGPCLANRRTVHALRSTLPERVRVVGLSVDTSAELVKSHLRSNPANDFEGMATLEFLEFVRKINASPSIPKTMYVDSKGRVADLSEGTQSSKWLAAMAKNLK